MWGKHSLRIDYSFFFLVLSLSPNLVRLYSIVHRFVSTSLFMFLTFFVFVTLLIFYESLGLDSGGFEKGNLLLKLDSGF